MLRTTWIPFNHWQTSDVANSGHPLVRKILVKEVAGHFVRHFCGSSVMYVSTGFCNEKISDVLNLKKKLIF